MTNTNQMTPFENKDLRGIIFTYCIMVEHADNYYLNPLLCLLKDDMLIRGYYDTDDWETLGDVTQHFGYLEDDQVYQVDEMRENLEYYHEQKLSDVVTYV